MSNFTTSIPVDLKPILDALPSKGVFVSDIHLTLDKKHVVVSWDCPRFDSGLSVPIEFPLENLSTSKPPKGVVDITKVQRPKKDKNLPTVKPEPTKAIPQPSYITTEEAFEKACSDNLVMEYQGIEPVWKPLGVGQGFTEGYFYRVKE